MLPKRKIFVSYHLAADQKYFVEFADTFSNIYEITGDDPIQSNPGDCSPEEAVLRIRSDLAGPACCTVVLCGPETPNECNVDWAIKAALDEGRGLIGVNLPNSRPDPQGRVQVPERLHENIASGCAMWLEWTRLIAAPLAMGAYIQVANTNIKKTGLIQNDAPPRQRGSV